MNSQEKRKNTNMKLYGVDNVSKLASVQAKRKESFSNRRNDLIFYQEPRVNILDGSTLSVYKLDNKVANKWLDCYHPFRSTRGNVLSLGLVNDNIIYSIMTFRRARHSRYIAELSRLYMLPTYNILRGYDILSDYASKFGISSVIAYVNLSFENVVDYESLGMTYIKTNQKKKWWYNGKSFTSDGSRRQKGLTNSDMIINNYLPYYDLGTAVYAVD